MQEQATATRTGDTNVRRPWIPLALALLATALFVWEAMTKGGVATDGPFLYGLTIGTGLTAAWYEVQLAPRAG